MILLGVKIDQITNENARKQCVDWLQSNHSVKLVFTPNPEIIVYAQRHPEFKEILGQADLALPDGAGVVWASHGAITERVTGADIMVELLAEANRQKLRVGIVMSPDGLSSQIDIAQVMTKQFPQIICSVTTTAFSTDQDLILVTLGAPDQERWAVEHKSQFQNVKIIMAVGGGIDYLTGKQRRAPVFLRSLRLEWLWRLITQPRRWKRIITATIIFPYLLMTSHDRTH